MSLYVLFCQYKHAPAAGRRNLRLRTGKQGIYQKSCLIPGYPGVSPRNSGTGQSSPDIRVSVPETAARASFRAISSLAAAFPRPSGSASISAATMSSTAFRTASSSVPNPSGSPFTEMVKSPAGSMSNPNCRSLPGSSISRWYRSGGRVTAHVAAGNLKDPRPASGRSAVLEDMAVTGDIRFSGGQCLSGKSRGAMPMEINRFRQNRPIVHLLPGYGASSPETSTAPLGIMELRGSRNVRQGIVVEIYRRDK